MHTVTSKLPDDLYKRLNNFGNITDRKKSYIIRQAIESFLQEKEKYFLTLSDREKAKYSLVKTKKSQDSNDLGGVFNKYAKKYITIEEIREKLKTVVKNDSSYH